MTAEAPLRRAPPGYKVGAKSSARKVWAVIGREPGITDDELVEVSGVSWPVLRPMLAAWIAVGVLTRQRAWDTRSARWQTCNRRKVT